MLVTAMSLLLCAAPTSVAVAGLNGVKLAPGEAELYGELLAQKLSERGFKVLTARDVSSLLGLERQRQLLGCNDDRSCLSEMVGALGVDLLVLGDLGQLDGEYTVTLKALSSRDGNAVAIFNTHVASAKQLPDELERASRVIAHQAAVAMQRPELEPSSLTSREGTVRKWALLPGILGLALLGAGAALELQARVLYDRTALGIDLDESYRTGRTLEPLGYVSIAVGGAALVTAILMYALGAESTVAPMAMLSPHGASFGLTGVLP